MISQFLLTIFASLILAQNQACDGEVSASCYSCTSSTELFTGCSWCSADGHCNGFADVGVACSGQWLGACSLSPAYTATRDSNNPQPLALTQKRSNNAAALTHKRSSNAAVEVCACGPNTACSGTCRNYAVGTCQQFYHLCTRASLGYVVITGSDSGWKGDIYADSACATTVMASFSNACGVCEPTLAVRVTCSPTSNIVYGAGCCLGMSHSDGVDSYCNGTWFPWTFSTTWDCTRYLNTMQGSVCDYCMWHTSAQVNGIIAGAVVVCLCVGGIVGFVCWRKRKSNA